MELDKQQQVEIQLHQLINIVTNLVGRIEQLEHAHKKMYVQKMIPLHKQSTP